MRPSNSQNGKHKGAEKKKTNQYTFTRPVRKHEIVPLATYMLIYKDDTADIGTGAIEKGTPYNGKRGGHSAAGINVNIPAWRTNR